MIKKLLFGLSFLCAGWMADAQPTFTSFSALNDSCINSMTIGNIYSVVTMGQFANPVTGNTAKVFWGDGSSSTANMWSPQGGTGFFSAGHSYVTAGAYTIKAILYDAASNPTDSTTTTLNAFCSTIHGITYERMDANCKYDVGVDQPIFAGQNIEVRKNNNPIDTFTAYGSFFYTVPNPDIVSEFSFHPLTAGTAFSAVCPATPYKVRLDTLYAAGSYGFDFGYTCNSAFTGFDLYTYGHSLLRPVNLSYLSIYAGNNACTPNNGTLTVNISPKYSYATASITPTSVTGNTLTWNLSGLSGVNASYIMVSLNPVGTPTPGDTAMTTLTITPTSGDVNTANNTYICVDSIRASFDPNDKKVQPAGDITAGQVLTYTINFENLGNDTAFNIYIIDTLSNNLDVSSFKLLQSSHRVGANHFKKGSANIVRFDFQDIRLADKSHPESNKGYVMYSVKAKTGLVAGDVVKNTAHIYFDINPAVVTNTTVSKLPVINSLPQTTAHEALNIYPNPTDDVLFIDNSQARYHQIQIINAIGQKVSEYPLTLGVNSIDISRLNTGVYYLSAFGNQETVQLKFVVK